MRARAGQVYCPKLGRNVSIALYCAKCERFHDITALGYVLCLDETEVEKTKGEGTTIKCYNCDEEVTPYQHYVGSEKHDFCPKCKCNLTLQHRLLEKLKEEED